MSAPQHSCPHATCTMTEIHGHGTDARYFPRRRWTSDPEKMEVCSRVGCTKTDVHTHQESRPGGYTHCFLPRTPAPVDPEMPDFDEDTDSGRGPGWGTRTCQTGCGYTTFGGYESPTEDEIREHFERCPVLHPPRPEPATAPTPGGFDAVLYAAYRAGVESEFERYDTDDNAEGFRRWRAQWHGEWVTE